MKSLSNLLLILLGFSFIGCSKPAKSGKLTMMVTANVRAQLDPCG